MIEEVDIGRAESLAKSLAAVCEGVPTVEVLVAIGAVIGAAADSGNFEVDFALSVIRDVARGEHEGEAE